MGQTTREQSIPLLRIIERNNIACKDDDGCISADSRIMGTYLHGLFDNPRVIKNWLNHIGIKDIDLSDVGGIEARDKEYDLLADHFEEYVDTRAIDSLIKNINKDIDA
jgi:adenosylcobyric acid synthase